jgi:hypothetical protein
MVKRIFMALCAVVLCGAVSANDTGMRRDSFYAGIILLRSQPFFLPLRYVWYRYGDSRRERIWLVRVWGRVSGERSDAGIPALDGTGR